MAFYCHDFWNCGVRTRNQEPFYEFLILPRTPPPRGLVRR